MSLPGPRSGPAGMAQVRTDFTAGLVRQAVNAAVRRYSPLHEEAMLREVARTLGHQSGALPERELALACAGELFTVTVEDMGRFFWKPGDGPETVASWRAMRPRGETVEEIAMPLLQAAAKALPSIRKSRPEEVLAAHIGHHVVSEKQRKRLRTALRARQKS